MKWIQRRFERVLVIFPFEEEIYRNAGVKADFVGHPLVDRVHATMTREEFAQRCGLDASRPIVAVLPGSRRSEIERNMPIIAEACGRLQQNTDAQFVIALAPGLKRQEIEGRTQSGLRWNLVEGLAYEALATADCAVVSSGTATVEAALLGTPMVIVYRVSRLTAAIARRLVKTRSFGMVNLTSGEVVVPELIQEGFTAEALEAELRRLLESPEARERQRASLAKIRAKLGPGGAIERAAEIIAETMNVRGVRATERGALTV